MPLLTIVPPMPGAERRFKPFVDFVHTAGWETEFVRLEMTGQRPPFGSAEIFPQIDAQTAGKVVMGGRPTRSKRMASSMRASLGNYGPVLNSPSPAKTYFIPSTPNSGRSPSNPVTNCNAPSTLS